MAFALRTGCTVVACIGAPGSGKTEHVVQRACELLEEGVPASEIAMVTVGDEASRLLRERLRRAVGAPADAIVVRSARRLAEEVLRASGDRLGLSPLRVLSPFEEKAYFQDMLTSGLRSKRLREMLRFFDRGVSDLTDLDEGWLVSEEEREVFALRRLVLDGMGAQLSCEVAGRAVRALMDRPGAGSFCAVLADDFQNLSHASQQLCALLAESFLMVAGDAGSWARGCDAYPYPRGLRELIASAACVEVVELEEGNCGAPSPEAPLALPSAYREALRLRASEDGSEAVLRPVKFARCESVEREIEVVVSTISALIEQGVRPSEIAVVELHSLWRRNLEQALRGHALSARVFRRNETPGDLRDRGRCREAQAIALLALCVNPLDGPAWRVWCGAGDHLACSDVFVPWLGEAYRKGVPLARVLASAARNGGERLPGGTTASAVLAAYREGEVCVERCARLRGEDLCAAVAAEVARRSTRNEEERGRLERELASRLDSWRLGASGRDAAAPDAAALLVEARRREASRFEGPEDGVLVGPPGALAGAAPQFVLVPAFVNGIMPRLEYFDDVVMTDERRRRWEEEGLAALRFAVGKAAGEVGFSAFTSLGDRAASALEVKIDRIGLRDGLRCCSVSPSVYGIVEP